MSADFVIETEGLAAGPVDARCPYLQYRTALGAGYIAGVLDYAVKRQHDFRHGGMHDRKTRARLMDFNLRHSLYLKDLGEFVAPIRTFVATVAGPAIRALNLTEPQFEPGAFEITAYPDGGHISEHIDTRAENDRARILSCVYYFSATPRAFSGGELRLYGFPKRTAPDEIAAPSPYVDIEPEADTLIVFPAWLRHEVLPVRVPSGAWADSRFTINCWIHRAPDMPRAQT
jgi:Rps23 Pro-64 3,4-dihydroxylase Tpa1-like proline 4-hydroxylase